MNMGALWENIQGAALNYGPKILTALIILVAAYVIAKLLAAAVKFMIGKIGLGSSEARADLQNTIGSAIFWVVMLVASPLILEPLGMQGILEPLQSMVQKFLAFLPNLIGAVLIFAIGFVVATVARKAVTGVLSAANVDAWAARAGMGEVTGSTGVSSFLGTLVFVLLIVPIAIAALDALNMQAISGPAKDMLQTILDAIPNIIGAAIVLLLAFVIARFASSILGTLLPTLGIDKIGNKIGLSKELGGGKSVSGIASTMAFAAIMIFGLIEAAKLLNFAILSEMLTEILSLGGRILLGTVIIAFGVFIANFLAGIVAQSKSGKNMAGLIKVAIIILASAMGLRQMGIANEIITMGFTLMLGSLAVGAAIAIGLGGKDAAGKLLDKWVKKL
ncbi:MAG: hypothetical protein COC23_05175 [Hyphomicrobiales bacterium]|nr:MAG: hypothetical protein COC23_05175 [Hyphomicrobiales bacterium]